MEHPIAATKIMADPGKVRLLPLGTPGVPPSVDYETSHAFMTGTCDTSVRLADCPPELRPMLSPTSVGVYCTRPPHDVEEPHVCFLHTRLDSAEPGVPRVYVVWGGE